MYFYSVIVPVFNRPDEIKELLESLCEQSYTNFEVIIVEDGSSMDCKTICESFKDRLQLQYFYKENTGQGFSRNFGFEKAAGDYFIVFDSDCLIPSDYFQQLEDYLQKTRLDAFGGPDAALESFTATQRAISYAMTSFFTTGGIRGGEKQLEKFRPRSFNMGISKAVYQKTGGYLITRMGEDIEFSIRIEKAGFKVGLIPKAKVYHKRRTSLAQFFKQLKFFGRARINVFRFYKSELKLVHLFPAFFTLGLVFLFICFFILQPLAFIGLGFLLLFVLLLFLDSLRLNKSLKIALLSVAAAFVQLTAYGLGFLGESLRYFQQPKPTGLRK